MNTRQDRAGLLPGSYACVCFVLVRDRDRFADAFGNASAHAASRPSGALLSLALVHAEACTIVCGCLLRHARRMESALKYNAHTEVPKQPHNPILDSSLLCSMTGARVHVS